MRYTKAGRVGVALLFVARSAWAGCIEAETRIAVSDVVRAGDQAWLAMDRSAVIAAVDDVERRLPCLDEALTPEDAAAVFRLRALGAFLRDDLEVAAGELAAATEVQPAYAWPYGMLPAGHPLERVQAEAREESPGRVRRQPRPLRGQLLLIDGTPSSNAPLERPWIRQIATPAGEVLETALVPAREPPPPYPGTPSFHGVERAMWVGRSLALAGTSSYLVSFGYLERNTEQFVPISGPGPHVALAVCLTGVTMRTAAMPLLAGTSLRGGRLARLQGRKVPSTWGVISWTAFGLQPILGSLGPSSIAAVTTGSDTVGLQTSATGLGLYTVGWGAAELQHAARRRAMARR